MKKIILPILFITLIACNSDKPSNTDNTTNNTIVSDFLADIESLEDVDDRAPIALFIENAKKEADDIFDIDENNIKEFLDAAKEYNHCIIVVEDHTILKIVDLEDCKQSGSWGACMPMAEGYIKKGDLDYQEDYINNIIGTPDSQERTAFLFK